MNRRKLTELIRKINDLTNDVTIDLGPLDSITENCDELLHLLDEADAQPDLVYRIYKFLLVLRNSALRDKWDKGKILAELRLIIESIEIEMMPS